MASPAATLLGKPRGGRPLHLRITSYNVCYTKLLRSVTFYGTAVVRQFEMMKVFSAIESQALVRSRDKLRSLQILSRAGLGLPKTVFTNYSRNVKDIVKSVGGAPVVIKLLEGTQGLGVVLAENENAAESVIEAFNGLKARVIIQEFIDEAKGSDIRAFVVDGVVVGAMKRHRITSYNVCYTKLLRWIKLAHS